MAKWIKFTDVNKDNLAHSAFLDLDAIKAFRVLDTHAELYMGDALYIHIAEGFAVQALERYFAKKSILIEKLGEHDVL